MPIAVDVYVVVEGPGGRDSRWLDVFDFESTWPDFRLTLVWREKPPYVRVDAPGDVRRLPFNLPEAIGDYRFFATQDADRADRALQVGLPDLHSAAQALE